MNNPIVLKTSRLPKILGELAHSNQFLKAFSLGALLVAVSALVVLAFAVNRAPLVLTLAPDASVLAKVETPKAEDQVRAAVHRYLEKRYNWTDENVAQQLKAAQAFVLPQGLKAFQLAMNEIVRFSAEKQVTQRTYPGRVQINLAQKTALVIGDRVTAIQGLKAAGDLKLQLTFEDGSRTPENPWGVYISKEREE